MTQRFSQAARPGTPAPRRLLPPRPPPLATRARPRPPALSQRGRRRHRSQRGRRPSIRRLPRAPPAPAAPAARPRAGHGARRPPPPPPPPPARLRRDAGPPPQQGESAGAPGGPAAASAPAQALRRVPGSASPGAGCPGARGPRRERNRGAAQCDGRSVPGRPGIAFWGRRCNLFTVLAGSPRAKPDGVAPAECVTGPCL